MRAKQFMDEEQQKLKKGKFHCRKKLSLFAINWIEQEIIVMNQIEKVEEEYK